MEVDVNETGRWFETGQAGQKRLEESMANERRLLTWLLAMALCFGMACKDERKSNKDDEKNEEQTTGTQNDDSTYPKATCEAAVDNMIRAMDDALDLSCLMEFSVEVCEQTKKQSGPRFDEATKAELLGICKNTQAAHSDYAGCVVKARDFLDATLCDYAMPLKGKKKRDAFYHAAKILEEAMIKESAEVDAPKEIIVQYTRHTMSQDMSEVFEMISLSISAGNQEECHLKAKNDKDTVACVKVDAE